jgi:predicted nucleic acid-binding protein
MPGRSWSIRTLVTTHSRIALDANVVIYLIENAEGHVERAAAVVDAIEQHGLLASMATLGQVEILTGSARAGDRVVFELVADEIRSMGLRFEPITQMIAEDAAWLRGQSRLDLADAIHVAAARTSGATAFITNDRRIRQQPGLDVFYLDDLELDPPLT